MSHCTHSYVMSRYLAQNFTRFAVGGFVVVPTVVMVRPVLASTVTVTLYFVVLVLLAGALTLKTGLAGLDAFPLVADVVAGTFAGAGVVAAAAIVVGVGVVLVEFVALAVLPLIGGLVTAFVVVLVVVDEVDDVEEVAVLVMVVVVAVLLFVALVFTGVLLPTLTVLVEFVVLLTTPALLLTTTGLLVLTFSLVLAPVLAFVVALVELAVLFGELVPVALATT